MEHYRAIMDREGRYDASLEREEIRRHQRAAPPLPPTRDRSVHAACNAVLRALETDPLREWEHSAIAELAELTAPAARVAVARLADRGLVIVRRFTRQGRRGAFTRVRLNLPAPPA